MELTIEDSNLKSVQQSISKGFAGLASGLSLSQTLNSRILGRIFNDFDLLKRSDFCFPQRVPRVGFWEELKSLSSTDFWSAYKKNMEKLKVEINEASKQSDTTYLKNLIRFGIRVGIHLDKNFDVYKVLGRSLEEEVLLSDLETSVFISRGDSIDFSKKYKLLERIEDEKGFKSLLWMSYASRLIVDFYRYKGGPEILRESMYEIIYPRLTEAMTKYCPLSPQDFQLLSTIYRGAAMLPFLSKDIKKGWLDKATWYCHKFKESYFCRDTGLELEHTLTLTLSKFYLYELQDDKLFIEKQRKLIQLDPQDSSPHLELGLYYYRNNAFKQARSCFSEALALGPPGLGLMAYFVGESNIQLGRREEALDFFHLSFSLDSLAVSPLLKIIEFGEIDQVRYAKSILRGDTCLLEQLTSEELLLLQG